MLQRVTCNFWFDYYMYNTVKTKNWMWPYKFRFSPQRNLINSEKHRRHCVQQRFLTIDPSLPLWKLRINFEFVRRVRDVPGLHALVGRPPVTPRKNNIITDRATLQQLQFLHKCPFPPAIMLNTSFRPCRAPGLVSFVCCAGARGQRDSAANYRPISFLLLFRTD